MPTVNPDDRTIFVMIASRDGFMRYTMPDRKIRYAKVKDSKGGMLMDKRLVVVTLFAIFLIAAILPRIIQKQKKVETVGCIGISRKLFFLGKLSLFTSFALILVRLFSGRLSLFEESDVFFWACVMLLAAGVAFFTLAIMRLGTFSLRVGLAQEETALRTTGSSRSTWGTAGRSSGRKIRICILRIKN